MTLNIIWLVLEERLCMHTWHQRELQVFPLTQKITCIYLISFNIPTMILSKLDYIGRVLIKKHVNMIRCWQHKQQNLIANPRTICLFILSLIFVYCVVSIFQAQSLQNDNKLSHISRYLFCMVDSFLFFSQSTMKLSIFFYFIISQCHQFVMCLSKNSKGLLIYNLSEVGLYGKPSILGMFSSWP